MIADLALHSETKSSVPENQGVCDGFQAAMQQHTTPAICSATHTHKCAYACMRTCRLPHISTPRRPSVWQHASACMLACILADRHIAAHHACHLFGNTQHAQVRVYLHAYLQIATQRHTMPAICLRYMLNFRKNLRQHLEQERAVGDSSYGR
eukprot:scaffold109248_cov18-Tisochrysis_lutea.AAC.1